MNTLGVQTREKLRMSDKLGKTSPKRKYCCTKMQFVAEKLQQKVCPFCNKKL
jgi:hypothetical protein